MKKDDDLDKMLEELEKYLAERLEEIEKALPKDLIKERILPNGTKEKEIGPIIYGYSIVVGPDGKPTIREFGNVRREIDISRQIKEEMEPLVDVVTSDNEVRIIAELPGVQKDDINLTLSQGKLVISVETENRKYYKEVELPNNVDEEKATARHNNGILEVTLPLKEVNKK